MTPEADAIWGAGRSARPFGLLGCWEVSGGPARPHDLLFYLSLGERSGEVSELRKFSLVRCSHL